MDPVVAPLVSSLRRALETGSGAARTAVAAASQETIEEHLADRIAALADDSAALKVVLREATTHGLPLRWIDRFHTSEPELLRESLASFLSTLPHDAASILVGDRRLRLKVPERVRPLWAADAAERVLPALDRYFPGNPWPRRAIHAARTGNTDLARTASFAIQTELLTEELKWDGPDEPWIAARAAQHAADALFLPGSVSLHPPTPPGTDHDASLRWAWEHLVELLLASPDPISGA